MWLAIWSNKKESYYLFCFLEYYNIEADSMISNRINELVKENYYITSEILFGTKISSGA